MQRRLRAAGRGFHVPRPAPPRLRPSGREARVPADLRGSDIVLALLGLTLLGATCLAIGVALLGRALGA